MKTLSQVLKNFVQEEQISGRRVIFVSGAQGAGKTTSVDILAGSNPSIAVLSLDDFYLPKTDRLKLAREVSPLFATRGPPGTHDIRLLLETITSLINSSKKEMIRIPVFDKLLDDRCKPSEWRSLSGNPSIIVVEGWLMGVKPKLPAELNEALNSVEAMDADGKWREYQEKQLNGDYKTLWDIGDSFFHILAPNFQAVKVWRTEQEETTLGLSKGALPDKRREWVNEFIMHYQRLTLRLLEGNCRDGLRVPITISRTPIDK